MRISRLASGESSSVVLGRRPACPSSTLRWLSTRYLPILGFRGPMTACLVFRELDDGVGTRAPQWPDPLDLRSADERAAPPSGRSERDSDRALSGAGEAGEAIRSDAC